MELFMIITGVLSRLLPHPANMTAVGGIAIFTGAKINTKKALVVTVTTMFISDLFLGFHSLMWATYGSILMAVFIGRWIQKNNSISRIISGTLASSIIFFIITNFAVWAGTPLYPKTIEGLTTCYVMAIPFFRNSLLGDCLYLSVFFSGYEIFTWMMTKMKLRGHYYARM